MDIGGLPNAAGTWPSPTLVESTAGAMLRIDFAHFLQVMKVKGSELGDGAWAAGSVWGGDCR